LPLLLQAFATAASGEEPESQVEGLAPGTEYELRAYAINAFGSSLPSESCELVSIVTDV